MVGSTAGLHIAGTYWNIDGLSVARGSTSPDHGIKAIFPQAIVFLPLPVNETKPLAFGKNSLATRIALGIGMSGSGRLSLHSDTVG